MSGADTNAADTDPDSVDWEAIARREMSYFIERNGEHHLGEVPYTSVANSVKNDADAAEALRQLRVHYVMHDCFVASRLEEIGELDADAPEERVVRHALDLVDVLLTERYDAAVVRDHYHDLDRAVGDYLDEQAADQQPTDRREPLLDDEH